MTLPTLPPSLRSDYALIADAHQKFLAKRGVLLPAEDTQQAVMLVYLFRNLGLLVSLELLRTFVRGHWAGQSQDLQPRHLKYDGWHILLSGKSGDRLKAVAKYTSKDGAPKSRQPGETLPNGHLMLVSVDDPSPDFELKKRRGAIDRNDWDSLKASYHNKCAVCKEPGALEKGHKDPSKSYTLDNIIPMCSNCNNWASSDMVFDDRGRVVALASARLIQKSDLAVKIRIFHELSNDKSVNPRGAASHKKR